MARIDSMRLLRARLREAARAPWVLLVLFAGDIAELIASIGLALASPPPAAAKAPYPVFDVPAAPVQVTLGVAIVGVAAGLLLGAALVAELVVMVRRAQIFNWKYGRSRLRGRARGRAGLARERST